MQSKVRARALVEYLANGQWCFGGRVYAANDKEAETTGLEAARGLWRRGAAGVRVTISTDRIALERLR